MNVLVVVAAAIAFVVAAWVHYVFWSAFFFLRTGEDEVVHAETRDGWRLALARRRPRGGRRGPPVLLVHGLGANRTSLDFGWERWSLSAYLAKAGFDCFALDLRGHGFSRRRPRGAPRHWTFDDYVRLDIPAALDAIRAITGASRVLWVGHSQGGMIGIAACGLYPDRIAGLVAMGSPVFFPSEAQLGLLTRLAVLSAGKLNRFTARILAPFSGYWYPAVSDVVINTRNVTGPVYRRLLVNVVENMRSGVLRQFGHWILTDTFTSADGRDDYRGAMARCRQPALFVAAGDDRLAPPKVVERAARAWGGDSTYLRIGIASSACCDYGHTDLLFGPRAPEEVFPPVRDWLVAHSTAVPEKVLPDVQRGVHAGERRA